MKLKYFIVGSLMSLLSCNEPKFSNDDLVGVWKADDGAKITVHKDGSCLLENLDNTLINSAQNKVKTLNVVGTWEIVNNINNGMTGGISTGIKFSYTVMNVKGGKEFYISGQGFYENKPPWDLFIWKGDPDNMIKYKFIKQ